MSIELRLPQTWHGWKMLFWLTIHCCPIHHRPMNRDWPQYDDGIHGFCFRCEGISIWPMGLLHCLYLNFIGQNKIQR